MTLRELKYVILGDDKLSDKMQRISGASDKAKKALGDHSDKVAGLKKKYGEAANSIPAFGGAIDKTSTIVAGVANPILIAAAAVVGLGLAFRKGAQEASQFELEFRKLENINLDKSASQIDGLRDRVLSTSFNKGIDPNKVSQGVFDIQSLTGNQGYGSDFIVSKQAEFARAAGADINKYISGTGVAMKNFGFGPGQIDAYNKSAMGLVSTAKITYDQLAEVSSMYAGPAAAANQSFNSANKLMAVFTTKTKSAEEAATLTKTAFTDLFKKSNIDSFQSIGIDLYDMNGNAKQVDQIMLELNKKFADKTSARQMDELRNKFQGSEGINALLAAAKDQSGALLKTFNAFDKGGDGMQKMLDNAKNDVNVIASIVEGRLKAATVSWGESVLPIKNWWNSIKADAIGSMSMMLKGGYWSSKRSADALYKDKTGQAASLENWYNSEMKVVDMAKSLTPQEYKISQDSYRKQYMDAFMIVNKKAGDFVAIEAARNKMSAIQEVSKSLRDAYNAPSTTPLSPDDNNPPLDPGINKGLNNVSGGGTRNVTVTIQKLVETLEINTTNLTDASGKVKQDIEAMLIRAISGAEQIIGAN